VFARRRAAPRQRFRAAADSFGFSSPESAAARLSPQARRPSFHPQAPPSLLLLFSPQQPPPGLPSYGFPEFGSLSVRKDLPCRRFRFLRRAAVRPVLPPVHRGSSCRRRPGSVCAAGASLGFGLLGKKAFQGCQPVLPRATRGRVPESSSRPDFSTPHPSPVRFVLLGFLVCKCVAAVRRLILQ
jgi:hypothetical protein